MILLNRGRTDEAHESKDHGELRKNPTIIQLEQEADRGSARAIEQLALRYKLGINVTRDEVAAKEVYRKYAEKGNVDAQIDLGWCYMNGDGVEKSVADGLRWWKEAGLRGNAEAQNLLGTWLFEGADGVKKDIPNAIHWYEKAANNGHTEAQFKLGQIYSSGENGVPRDYLKAKNLLKQAIDGGHKYAKTEYESNNRKEYLELAEKDRNRPGVVESMNTSSNKPDDSLVHLSSDSRLDSGAVLVDNVSSFGGKGAITLDNGLTDDAYVKVIRSGKLAVSFYVRGGQRHTFSHLPDGSYEVLYCTGFDWDSAKRDFSRGRNAHKYISPLTFATRTETKAGGVTTYTDAITLTLHKVVSGNARTTEISVSEFDKY